jgi:hypothetical protein
LQLGAGELVGHGLVHCLGAVRVAESAGVPSRGRFSAKAPDPASKSGISSALPL